MTAQYGTIGCYYVPFQPHSAWKCSSLVWLKLSNTQPKSFSEPWSAWIAWASSRLSSSVFMVTKRRTSKLSEAATIASPNRMNTKANITYSGRLFSELSFCNATMSPNPIVVKVMKQLKWTPKRWLMKVSKERLISINSLINWIEIFPVFKFWKSSSPTSNGQTGQCGYHTD